MSAETQEPYAKSTYTKAKNWTIRLEYELELYLEQQSLDKVETVCNFVTYYAFAIENTWVTTMMVSFTVESYIDCFMWTIPIWVSVFIRPYILSYVSKIRLSLSCHMRHLALFYLGAAVGHLLILLCMYPTYFVGKDRLNFVPYHFLRIFLGIAAWTTVDVCLEFVAHHVSELSTLKYRIEGPEIEYKDDSDVVALFARIIAYGLSMYTCLAPFTFRNFQNYTGILYLSSGFLCVFAAIHTFLTHKVKIIKGHEGYKPYSIGQSIKYIKDSVLENKINLKTFFPGLSETLRAPLEAKQYLAIQFAYNYVADTVCIYSCIWFAVTEMESYDITAQMYIVGIRWGATLLGIMSIALFLTKKIFGSLAGNNYKRFLNLFRIVVTLVTIAGIAAGVTMQRRAIATMIILTGILIGFSELYFDHWGVKLTYQFPTFYKCSGFVGTLYKIFILFPMPFYWMILMADDDIPNCIWWAVIAMFVLWNLLNHQYYEQVAKEEEEPEEEGKLKKY